MAEFAVVGGALSEKFDCGSVLVAVSWVTTTGGEAGAVLGFDLASTSGGRLLTRTIRAVLSCEAAGSGFFSLIANNRDATLVS